MTEGSFKKINMKRSSTIIPPKSDHDELIRKVDVAQAGRSEMPTPVISEASKIWCHAADELSQKLVECAKHERASSDVLDVESVEKAFRLAYELLKLRDIMESLPLLNAEMATNMRRSCISRIIQIHNEADAFLIKLPDTSID